VPQPERRNRRWKDARESRGKLSIEMAAIGGGVDFETANANVQVISDGPIVKGGRPVLDANGKESSWRGWRVTMHNNGVADVNGAWEWSARSDVE
jgi:hypothetical protein